MNETAHASKPRVAVPSRVPSHPYRQHERLAIGPTEQTVRFRIVEDGLGLGVEAESMADAEGDVAEVTEPRAFVPFLDVGVGSPAAADAVQEVLQMGTIHRD